MQVSHISRGSYLPPVERQVAGVGGEEEHVDEVDEDAGGHHGVGGAERHPLVEDEEDEVAEERQEENHLGQQLQHQPVPLLEVPGQGDISLVPTCPGLPPRYSTHPLHPSSAPVPSA